MAFWRFKVKLNEGTKTQSLRLTLVVAVMVLFTCVYYVTYLHAYQLRYKANKE